MVYFKENNNVWDIRFGYGKVSNIIDNEVFVKFGDRLVRYTTDGRFSKDENVSLLQVEPNIQRNVPIVSFEQGELVLVVEGTQLLMLYYSHYNEGKHYCFNCQNKDGKTNVWRKVIKYADNPLLKKES